MLNSVTHRVPMMARDNMRNFYTKGMGMKLLKSTDNTDFFRFAAPDSDQSTGVELFYDTKATDVNPTPLPAYWKIGVAVHDVDEAAEFCKQLPTEIRPAVGKGSQFLDVGYVSHICDPCGSTIELLQTTQENNATDRKKFTHATQSSSAPLYQEGQKTMGQITTRAKNADQMIAFYRDYLGMKLVTVENVEMYNFELYFFAFTNENPPNTSDLNAVENREWCYQRPYTTLEIQVKGSNKYGKNPVTYTPNIDTNTADKTCAGFSPAALGGDDSGNSGFLGITVEAQGDANDASNPTKKLWDILKANGKTNKGDSIIVRDQDNIQVKIQVGA